ncbi:hypothetical protein QU24_04865 [Pantoea rodasii]|uniref:Uncharacterized protein n=1 Tax=Pantoea rodasii TaxID=1076549 RepID=A0A0B1RC64_9GAMM|nr:hypothetical protein [Pantoea rodasii]KHJ69256.1 hypothetical protein QU24_04865 [Pantoea rodasii]
MQITYHVDYQYKLPGDDRPVASGSVMRSSAEETLVMFLPAEGDFVEINGNPTHDDTLKSFRGRVVSRLFRYERQSETEVFCHINIIVEECGQDFTRLVSE